MAKALPVGSWIQLRHLAEIDAWVLVLDAAGIGAGETVLGSGFLALDESGGQSNHTTWVSCWLSRCWETELAREEHASRPGYCPVFQSSRSGARKNCTDHANEGLLRTICQSFTKQMRVGGWVDHEI